jgi:hypothetical protein
MQHQMKADGFRRQNLGGAFREVGHKIAYGKNLHAERFASRLAILANDEVGDFIGVTNQLGSESKHVARAIRDRARSPVLLRRPRSRHGRHDKHAPFNWNGPDLFAGRRVVNIDPLGCP